MEEAGRGFSQSQMLNKTSDRPGHSPRSSSIKVWVTMATAAMVLLGSVALIISVSHSWKDFDTEGRILPPMSSTIELTSSLENPQFTSTPVSATLPSTATIVSPVSSSVETHYSTDESASDAVSAPSTDMTTRHAFTCSAVEFQCLTVDECIPLTWQCNSLFNCPDNSDELNCEYECTSYQFQCQSGHCILLDNICNGVNHCPDDSDEDQDLCSVPCALRYRCDDGGCTYPDWVCDGEEDCDDGSDEAYCGSESSDVNSCGEFEFRCDSGQCISFMSVCDYVEDCLDGSDEAVDYCG
ncbi:low-density lipoprotein receptor-like [Ptychodera flava]|uniref:low-density lipoprotein receptor-like n=1 Tax=Ptychodera flava TaxID=63121 RepID=UPI00396A2D63